MNITPLPIIPPLYVFFGGLSEDDEMAVDVFLFAPTAFSVVVWYSCAVRSFRGHTRRLFHVLHISPQVGAVTPVDAVAPCAACLTLFGHGLKGQVVLWCWLLLLRCASSKELHVLRKLHVLCLQVGYNIGKSQHTFVFFCFHCFLGLMFTMFKNLFAACCHSMFGKETFASFNLFSQITLTPSRTPRHDPHTLQYGEHAVIPLRQYGHSSSFFI